MCIALGHGVSSSSDCQAEGKLILLGCEIFLRHKLEKGTESDLITTVIRQMRSKKERLLGLDLNS